MSSKTIQKLKDQVAELQKKLNTTKKPIKERNVFESENKKLTEKVKTLEAEVSELRGKIDQFEASAVEKANG